MKLILGVLDVAYTEQPGPMKRKQGPQRATTTGKVAEILEKNYAVMETFFASRKDQIAQWIADDMAKSIQDLVKGGIDTSGRMSTVSHRIGGKQRTVSAEQAGSYTYGADQKIEAAFRAFIFGREMAKLKGAVISKAAQAGKSKRFKSGHTPGKQARPEFVDTGLYVAAFRAWSEQ